MLVRQPVCLPTNVPEENAVSKTVPTKSITPTAIQARKGGQPIVGLTSYTAPMTKLVDRMLT